MDSTLVLILPILLLTWYTCQKKSTIVCYMWAEDLASDLTSQWADKEALFYFILWLYENIFFKSFVEKNILKYYDKWIDIYI